MDIKYKLQEYKWIKENVQALEDRLLEIDTALQKITTNLEQDKVQTNKDPDKWTNLIYERMKVENYINSQIAKGLEEMHYIENLIDQLDERGKLLMRYRYIDCLTWEEIACKMYYTWQHMHRIHSKCLIILEESIKKNDVIECDTKTDV